MQKKDTKKGAAHRAAPFSNVCWIRYRLADRDRIHAAGTEQVLLSCFRTLSGPYRSKQCGLQRRRCLRRTVRQRERGRQTVPVDDVRQVLDQPSTRTLRFGHSSRISRFSCELSTSFFGDGRRVAIEECRVHFREFTADGSFVRNHCDRHCAACYAVAIFQLPA